LAHSENLKLTQIYLIYLIFSHCGPELSRNCGKNSLKEILEKPLHYGPIPQKVLYKIFSNIPFWNAPRLPTNTPSLVFSVRHF
jgi:hypothetical protein